MAGAADCAVTCVFIKHTHALEPSPRGGKERTGTGDGREPINSLNFYRCGVEDTREGNKAVTDARRLETRTSASHHENDQIPGIGRKGRERPGGGGEGGERARNHQRKVETKC